MTTPESPLERLCRLRDAVDKPTPLHVSRLQHLEDFAAAAHEALGPDGCVTKELERLQDIEMEVESWKDALRESQPERDALRQHVNGAEKENAVLLARLAKLSAAARVCDKVFSRSADDWGHEAAVAFTELQAVLNEVPPHELGFNLTPHA